MFVSSLLTSLRCISGRVMQLKMSEFLLYAGFGPGGLTSRLKLDRTIYVRGHIMRRSAQTFLGGGDTNGLFARDY